MSNDKKTTTKQTVEMFKQFDAQKQRLNELRKNEVRRLTKTTATK